MAERDSGKRGLWCTDVWRKPNPRTVVPYAIYLLGVNPPAEVTEAELEVFNDFYTTVHLPEVAARRHALRAERYELVREVRAPYTGAPRFVAIYEVDEEAASRRRHTGPPYATGPEVWKGHKTPWRLWYRRLGAGHALRPARRGGGSHSPLVGTWQLRREPALEPFALVC